MKFANFGVICWLTKRRLNAHFRYVCSGALKRRGGGILGNWCYFGDDCGVWASKVGDSRYVGQDIYYVGLFACFTDADTHVLLLLACIREGRKWKELARVRHRESPWKSLFLSCKFSVWRCQTERRYKVIVSTCFRESIFSSVLSTHNRY